MITLLTYLYYSLWDVEIDKEFFALLSAIEVAVELYLVLAWLLIFHPWRKDF